MVFMDKKILQFAILLRKAGIKVSHSEVSDCLKSLAIVGFERETFYNALAATLVKDHSDFYIFDKMFYYYFNPDFFAHQNESVSLPDPAENALSKGNCTGDDKIPGIDGERSTGFGQGQGLATKAVDEFVHVIKLGNYEHMVRMVRKGIESLGSIDDKDLIDMKEAVRQVKVHLEWNMGVYTLEKQACSDEKAWLTWQERLNNLESLLLRELEKTLINHLGDRALEVILERENLNQLDFYRLSSHQVAEIKKRVSRIGHRLASRLSFRRKRAKRGRIDLPGTIRKSMNTGGVPIKPAFKDRYPTRPEFVVLCDISGSVKVFSEFMLQLVYSIQTRFIHVRSFVFVDTPDEITGYFQNCEIEEGIKDIYNKAKFSKTAFSNYGEMFIDFCTKYFDSINKKTTLLVIGDARNNYHSDQADYFQKMSNEVKKVIWLNPEPVERWDREDSLISVYARFCSNVFECRNLEQLDRLAGKII